jgi:adiponectin receptor
MTSQISHFCNKLDYIGIVAMIVGSFFPMLHYGYYCNPHLQLFYSLSILSLGGLATYTVVAPKFTTPAYRPIRTTVFLALGLSAIVPVAHICALYGVSLSLLFLIAVEQSELRSTILTPLFLPLLLPQYQAVSTTMGLSWLVTGGALYVIGACLYMFRVPERLSPGTFDYFGASHQIFHILILLAAFSHYVCIRRSYTFWHTVEAINGAAICQAFETLRHQ